MLYAHFDNNLVGSHGVVSVVWRFHCNMPGVLLHGKALLLQYFIAILCYIMDAVTLASYNVA